MHSGLDEGGRPEEQAGLGKPATLRQCHEVIEAQALQIAQLREQMALLQERLKLDSRNSSKPPSSDGPAVGNRAQRRAIAILGATTQRFVVGRSQPRPTHHIKPHPSCAYKG